MPAAAACGAAGAEASPLAERVAAHVLALAAGEHAAGYAVRAFPTSLAAIDATLASLIEQQDVVLASRDLGFEAQELLHDWYGLRGGLDVAVHRFEGFMAEDCARTLESLRGQLAARLAAGRRIVLYLESPGFPHGYVLDVAGICRFAHERGITVVVDGSHGACVLQPLLRRAAATERPDYLVCAFPADGEGGAFVIAAPERIEQLQGAALGNDAAALAAAELRSLEPRVLQRGIATTVLARVLDAHPLIHVRSSALPGDANHALARRTLALGLPAPLLSLDFQAPADAPPPIEPAALERFVGALEAALAQRPEPLGAGTRLVRLGAHGAPRHERSGRSAPAAPVMLGLRVGEDDPRIVLALLMRAAERELAREAPAFVRGFPRPQQVDRFYEGAHLALQHRWLRSQRAMAALLAG